MGRAGLARVEPLPGARTGGWGGERWGGERPARNLRAWRVRFTRVFDRSRGAT
jgi:hypothetical protein